jgi:Holliday junction resolvase RusA-like endonuclease
MRPRFFMRGSHPSVYDPQTKEKAHIRAIMQRWIMDNNYEKTISLAQDQVFEVGLWFGMPIAESVKKGQKNRFLWGMDYHIQKPDLDNCEKFILDCGNGILWRDDSQIISLQATKAYTENPCTIINFSVIQPTKLDNTTEAVLMLFSPSKMENFIIDTKRLSQAKIPQNIQDPEFQLLASLVVNFAAKYADDLKKLLKVKNG